MSPDRVQGRVYKDLYTKERGMHRLPVLQFPRTVHLGSTLINCIRAGDSWTAWNAVFESEVRSLIVTLKKY
jgi:hypothetical protein